MKKKPLSASDPAKEPHGYLIFLSHATHDKWIAEVVREKILAKFIHVRVWLDNRDIAGGDRIPDEIQRAIRECDELIVLATPASQDRPWITLEIGAAWGLQKRIVPLCYHVEPETLNAVVRDLRAYPLHEFDAFLDDLGKRMGDRP
jgi:hypothetical protein